MTEGFIEASVEGSSDDGISGQSWEQRPSWAAASPEPRQGSFSTWEFPPGMGRSPVCVAQPQRQPHLLTAELRAMSGSSSSPCSYHQPFELETLVSPPVESLLAQSVAPLSLFQ